MRGLRHHKFAITILRARWASLSHSRPKTTTTFAKHNDMLVLTQALTQKQLTLQHQPRNDWHFLEPMAHMVTYVE
jgi:hypothetical protein